MTDPLPHGAAPRPPTQAAAPIDPAEPTGHRDVDEATASVDRLEHLPVDEHVAVFEAAHDRLRAVLADAAETASTA